MCGITGFVDFRHNTSDAVLEAMTDALGHRGPDDRGHYVTDLSSCRVGLGHTRLSIIDLSEGGSQPRLSRDGRQAIVFNGEIYNYRELKGPLKRFGARFKSSSDTEVILEAYRAQGALSVESFIGMFAYAILDEPRRKLLLVRDRAGVKPLFYAQMGGVFLFGSELKALMEHPVFERRIDSQSLHQYLRYGWVPGPRSIFEGTFKLLPGHFLELDLDTGAMVQTKYWDVLDAYRMPQFDMDASEALEELESLLTSAFEYRMVADVPVGVFLSGGYDSTAVAALLQKSRSTPLSTYTIGFEEPEYDESSYAREIAKYLGTNHTELMCTAQDALDVVQMLPTMFDEPFGDTSAIPTYLVSKLASSELKVVLSADAGDESFAGYSRYLTALKLHSVSHRLPDAVRWSARHGLGMIPRGMMNRLAKLEAAGPARNWHRRLETVRRLAQSDTDAVFYDAMMSAISMEEASSLLKGEHAPACLFPESWSKDVPDFLRFMLVADYKNYMVDDILQKVDRASMAVALESREPLLDHRIIEFAARLPNALKVKDGSGKWLLRELVHRHVPRDLVERPKAGFTPPMREWLHNELRDLLEESLAPARIRSEGIFNWKAVDAAKRSFLSNANLDASRIWRLVSFQMWASKWGARM